MKDLLLPVAVILVGIGGLLTGSLVHLVIYDLAAANVNIKRLETKVHLVIYDLAVANVNITRLETKINQLDEYHKLTSVGYTLVGSTNIYNIKE